MEVIETDRINIIAERRKWQMEMENKRRQLEDDKRSLQHLKSKALRERWLLDGVPSGGSEHEEVKRQLQKDEERTRALEETISSLERELVILESGGGPTIAPAPEVQTELIKEVEVLPVKPESGRDAAVGAVTEVKGHVAPRVSRDSSGDMKRAVYSVEIRVERDNLTGETRVLSTNTTLPMDPGQGVKVYEDERKVVHEMNGEDGGHVLSSTEVEELIHKADEATMKSQTVITEVTSTTVATTDETSSTITKAKNIQVVHESRAEDDSGVSSVEITGLEAKPEKELSASEATEDNPVTMVFMGYQNVEDEDETKKVLGLKGTVKAELVVIEEAEGKTSPVEQKAVEKSAKKAATPAAAAPKEPEKAPESKNGDTAAASAEGESAGETEEGAKKKQPCKCCTIM